MEELNRILEIEKNLCAPGSYFETEEAEVLGEPMQVFKNRMPSLRSFLEMSAAHGDKEYLIFEDRRITYADHFKAVVSVAKALQEKYGVQKGDRVAILGANSPEWIISFWAIISIGAIAVGQNGWWTADEILYSLEDSKPKLMIGDVKRLVRLKGIEVPVPVVVMEDDFNTLTSYDPEAVLSIEPLDEDDPACILYTSGTTGRPKGVVSSHRALNGAVQAQFFHGLRAMQVRGVESPQSPATMLTSPLFHGSGLTAGAIVTMAAGIKTVMMSGRFDPVEAARLIEHEGITGWGPMDTIIRRFVKEGDARKFDLSGVLSIGNGGAPMPIYLQDSIRECFPNAGDSLALAYGSTECGMIGAINYGEELKWKPLSSGRPMPTVELEIRDMNGNSVGENVDGEIFIRSPMVMLEYWQKPEETTKALTKGRWLATGDFAKLEDGHLIINSRAKDIILRGAENVYPMEVEVRLEAHPGVAETAVIGIESEEYGQEVKAVVVGHPGISLDTDELAIWVGQTLAYFKVPTSWQLRSTPLPRNAVGKVMKHLLDESYENPFQED